jgi:molybdopterin-guanine dinucleotide biosynthesis protein A
MNLGAMGINSTYVYLDMCATDMPTVSPHFSLQIIRQEQERGEKMYQVYFRKDGIVHSLLLALFLPDN